MKSVIAAIAAIAAAVVSAQTIVSSQPAANQQLVPGTTTSIVWAPVDGTITTIDLRQGNALALNMIQNIATNVPASTGSYSWTIPATLADGTDYAISFGQSPGVTYTPFFILKAASSNSSSAAPASTTAAATTAAATTAAASSTGKAAHTAASVTIKSGSAASSAASSAAKPTTDSTSAGNKNIAAVGVAAIAGAVVAALI